MKVAILLNIIKYLRNTLGAGIVPFSAGCPCQVFFFGHPTHFSVTSYGHPTHISVTSYGHPTQNSVTSYGHPTLISVTIGTRILKLKLKMKVKMKFFTIFTMLIMILRSLYTIYVEISFQLIIPLINTPPSFTDLLLH